MAAVVSKGGMLMPTAFAPLSIVLVEGSYMEMGGGITLLGVYFQDILYANHCIVSF